MSDRQRGADLLVRCLEAAGVRYVFGIPGEETLDLVDALDQSPIRFISTRHEQSAAFMADVWGCLTGEAGVCASTLGPGATNLITGVADAYLDRAPLVAIAGQGATKRLHKQSHQIIDLAALFGAVTKQSKRIGESGAIAAKLAFPERTVVTATGDAGFLMNAQELETALRLDLALVVLVWNDSGYGLIEWHQQRRFGRSNDVSFSNPDFIAFAESFGARGFRVESAANLEPTLRAAIDCGTVAVVDCPVDYRENIRLTERLGRLTCNN